MPDDPKPSPENPPPDAARHVAEAHRILRSLKLPLGEHPELTRAIDNLEMALSILGHKNRRHAIEPLSPDRQALIQPYI